MRSLLSLQNDVQNQLLTQTRLCPWIWLSSLDPRNIPKLYASLEKAMMRSWSVDPSGETSKQSTASPSYCVLAPGNKLRQRYRSVTAHHYYPRQVGKAPPSPQTPEISRGIVPIWQNPTWFTVQILGMVATCSSPRKHSEHLAISGIVCGKKPHMKSSRWIWKVPNYIDVLYI